jgi:Tfp pilus assembly protein PilO
MLSCLLVGIVVLFVSTENKIKSVNKLLIEAEQHSTNLVKLDELRSTLPSMKGEITTYQKTLPSTESEVAVFAATLEKIAKESGMTIVFHMDDFTKIVEVSSQKINGLGIQLDLVGNFAGLVSFQTKLSELPFFFKIDKISVTKNENRPGLKAVFVGYLMMSGSKK